MMFEIENKIFYDKINIVKFDHIIKSYDLYKERIEEQEKDMRRSKGYDALKSFIKMRDQVFIPEEYIGTEYGLIKITYKKGENSNNIGRWYADKGIGIQPLCGLVRSTICDNIYVDIDQVNSHPSILNQLLNKYDFKSPKLEKYLNNREKYLNKVMIEENCTRDKAKTKIISIINGSSKYNGLKLKALDKEIKPLIASLILKPEFQYIYTEIIKNYKINIIGKTISRVLQVIENNILHENINFFYKRGLIEIYKGGYLVSLIFDGFQNLLSNEINNELLKECSLYTKNKTGYEIELKIKAFDNKLELPDNYNSTFNINDYISNRINNKIKSYNEYKTEFEKTNAKIIYPPMIASLTNKGYELQTINNFIKGLQHIKVKVNEFNKKNEEIEKIKTFVDVWLNDPNIRVYERNVFKPTPLITEYYEHNSWIDFKIKDEPLILTDRDYFKEWCEFCNNLIGDKKIAEIIISRYAQRIQTPANRTNICLVLYGEERIGKNRLIMPIKKIMGEYYQELDSAKKLYEKHSMYEYQKLFLCINEAQGLDNFSNADILKTRITEPTIPVNPKGIQPFQIDNMCDYDMTTNNFNVIKITDDSYQRFFQVECTNYYKGNQDFFNDYINNIENNPIAIRQIYEGLMKYNIKDIIPSGNFQIDKPITTIEEQVKEQNKDKILLFLEDHIRDYIDEDNEIEILKYSNQEFFNRWLIWLKDTQCEIKMDKHKFGIKLSKLIKSKFKDNEIIKDTKNSTTKINYKKLAVFFNIEMI
jgi:hypothetical protein